MEAAGVIYSVIYRDKRIMAEVGKWTGAESGAKDGNDRGVAGCLDFVGTDWFLKC